MLRIWLFLLCILIVHSYCASGQSQHVYHNHFYALWVDSNSHASLRFRHVPTSSLNLSWHYQPVGQKLSHAILDDSGLPRNASCSRNAAHFLASKPFYSFHDLLSSIYLSPLAVQGLKPHFDLHAGVLSRTVTFEAVFLFPVRPKYMSNRDFHASLESILRPPMGKVWIQVPFSTCKRNQNDAD